MSLIVLGEVRGVLLADLLFAVRLDPGGTKLRQDANFDSRAPTFRNKSLTMFKAEILVEGDNNGSGCPEGELGFELLLFELKRDCFTGVPLVCVSVFATVMLLLLNLRGLSFNGNL